MAYVYICYIKATNWSWMGCQLTTTYKKEMHITPFKNKVHHNTQFMHCGSLRCIELFCTVHWGAIQNEWQCNITHIEPECCHALSKCTNVNRPLMSRESLPIYNVLLILCYQHFQKLGLYLLMTVYWCFFFLLLLLVGTIVLHHCCPVHVLFQVSSIKSFYYMLVIQNAKLQELVDRIVHQYCGVCSTSTHQHMLALSIYGI